MCRDLQHQPSVPSPQPPTAANQDLIDRLRTLLQAPDFEQQLNQVRHFLFSLSLSHTASHWCLFLGFRSLLQDLVVYHWANFTFCF